MSLCNSYVLILGFAVLPAFRVVRESLNKSRSYTGSSFQEEEKNINRQNKQLIATRHTFHKDIVMAIS